MIGSFVLFQHVDRSTKKIEHVDRQSALFQTAISFVDNKVDWIKNKSVYIHRSLIKNHAASFCSF